MKTLTYISKYHFIKITYLLIGLMWQVDVSGQSLENLPNCLIIDETTPTSIHWLTEGACINGITNMNGTFFDQDPSCPTTNPNCNPSYTDNYVEEDLFQPYEFIDVEWGLGIDCYINEGVCIPPAGNDNNPCLVTMPPQPAFTIIASDDEIYDTRVTRNGVADVLQMAPPSDNDYFIRIGDLMGGAQAYRLTGVFEIDPDNPILKYNYALAMQDVLNEHGGNTLQDTGRPFFTIRFTNILDNEEEEEIYCGQYSVIGITTSNSALDDDDIIIGDELRSFPGMVVNWSENVVDLSNYEGTVKVEVTLAECDEAGHTAWAYLDFSCESSGFEVTKDGDGCTYNFSTAYTGNYGDDVEYLWKFLDAGGNVVGESDSANPSFTYNESGEYTVNLTIEYTNYPNGNDGSEGEVCEVFFTEEITICCDYCASDFAPFPGSEYVISAWVKENTPTAVTEYLNPNITLLYEGSSDVGGPFYASGAIIDDWQRIEAVFNVPVDAETIKIQLNNAGSNEAFFDDIRIHPFDASMKSFVYDPVTLRLSAELDERNYATYYEYDEEGALIRIKKETERGVMTIQEARNGIQKEQ